MELAARVALCVLLLFLVGAPLAAAVATGLTSGERAMDAFRGAGWPLLRSIGVAGVAGSVAVMLGVGFANFLDRCRSGVRQVSWLVALLALAVPPYVVGDAWVTLFGPAGLVSKPLALVFTSEMENADALAKARFAAPAWIYSTPAVGFLHGAMLFPVVALATAAILRRTDRRIFEAARLARGMRGVLEVFASVLLPPALGAGLIVSALAFSEFSLPQLLRVRTVGERVYDSLQEGNLAGAALLTLPMFPLLIAASGAGLFMLTRSRHASLAALEGDVPREALPARGLMWTLATVGVVLFSTAPALLVPLVSLSWLTLSSGRAGPAGPTDSHFTVAVGHTLNMVWPDAARTLALALVAAVLAVTLATAAGLALARRRRRAADVPMLLPVLLGLLAVPGPIVALGLIALWNRPGFAVIYQSNAIVLLCWLGRFFQVALAAGQLAFSRIDPDIDAAAALMGHPLHRRVMRVLLPMAAPGLIAGGLAVYVLSAAEFSATGLIVPAGSPLLAPSVVNLMRRGHDSQIAAAQLLLLLVIGAPLVALLVFGTVAMLLRRTLQRGKA